MHRDDEASKFGMWLFIFTEILLFGGLFVVYTVYRSIHPEAFRLAGEELDWVIGSVNTVILIVSSATIAMSITAIQKGNKKLTLQLLYTTVILALIFLVNKYFEWGSKFDHGFYPSSEVLGELGFGTILFFGLYFFMTGLHAFHIIVGVVFIGFIINFVHKGKIDEGNHQLLENSGLYWHLVDLIWIFLFPLFYLIH